MTPIICFFEEVNWIFNLFRYDGVCLIVVCTSISHCVLFFHEWKLGPLNFYNCILLCFVILRMNILRMNDIDIEMWLKKICNLVLIFNEKLLTNFLNDQYYVLNIENLFRCCISIRTSCVNTMVLIFQYFFEMWLKNVLVWHWLWLQHIKARITITTRKGY